MKFEFQVEYIHQSFIDAHPTMSESHPDFIKAISRTTIELEYKEETTLEQVEQNIILALQQDGCKVLRIEGKIVE